MPYNAKLLMVFLQSRVFFQMATVAQDFNCWFRRLFGQACLFNTALNFKGQICQLNKHKMKTLHDEHQRGGKQTENLKYSEGNISIPLDKDTELARTLKCQQVHSKCANPKHTIMPLIDLKEPPKTLSAPRVATRLVWMDRTDTAKTHSHFPDSN